MRDRIADRKARTPGRNETTVLSAVALDEAATPLGGRSLTVDSDYGATAAVAAAVALAAAELELRPGAGHLRDFVTLHRLLTTPLLRSLVRDDTGLIPGSDQQRCRRCRDRPADRRRHRPRGRARRRGDPSRIRG